jgi:hydroxypyruvate reductase
MNTVRKHLSRIKGGRLAAACHPASVWTLTISDVPGDDPAVIASGPTVADNSTCEQALAILDRYGIAIPAPVRQALLDGSLETPKPSSGVFAAQQVKMLATPMQSLQAAAEAARATGLNAYVLSDEIEGESRDIAKMHAALARAAAKGHGPFQTPCVLLSGGETTVTLRPQPLDAPRGKGGRAGEFCLGLAVALQGQVGVWGLAADTDGIDGTEDNAGALLFPGTVARATAKGVSAQKMLANNDGYSYFEAIGDLLVTGPTRTNVNDYRVILVL